MPSSITSSSCSSVSTYGKISFYYWIIIRLLIIMIDYRMENFLTRHELARNFYDDFEFCPVYLLDKEVNKQHLNQKR